MALEVHQHPQGVSSERLSARLGVSRPTVDRDLSFLRTRVGLAIDRVRKSGEVWHKLRELPLAAVAASPLQIVALRLAREALEPLGGTALVDQLDGLIALLPVAPKKPKTITRTRRLEQESEKLVRLLDEAIRGRKQVEISARPGGAEGAIRTYRLDPLGLRLVGEVLYLLAWSHERRAARTFKVTRIHAVRMRQETAAEHPEVLEEEMFAGAVKAWSGAMVRARVRLAKEVAWLAREYPLLASQEVTAEADGTAVVSAEVAGIVEAKRWVLSWGKGATVLEPPELREAVVAELSEALHGYRGARVRSPYVSEPDGGGDSLGTSRGARSASEAP